MHQRNQQRTKNNRVVQKCTKTLWYQKLRYNSSRGYKKDIARENPDFIGVFTVLYGKISATDFVDVNRSFFLYVRFCTPTQPNNDKQGR